MDTSREHELRSYLLNQLPQSRLEMVERAILEDSTTYDLLELAEDELIDLYLTGKLDSGARLAFEERCLNSEDQRKRIGFHKVFNEYLHLRNSPELVARGDVESSRAGRNLLKALVITCLVLIALISILAAYHWGNTLLGTKVRIGILVAPLADFFLI